MQSVPPDKIKRRFLQSTTALLWAKGLKDTLKDTRQVTLEEDTKYSVDTWYLGATARLLTRKLTLLRTRLARAVLMALSNCRRT